MDIMGALHEQLEGTNAVKEPHHLPPGWEPPPAVASGTPCLYVLAFDDEKFYIGETESLAQRLASHRQRFGQQLPFHCILYPLKDRSVARAAETDAIRLFRQHGVFLHNVGVH